MRSVPLQASSTVFYGGPNHGSTRLRRRPRAPRWASASRRSLNPFVVVLTYLGEILILLGQAIKALRGGMDVRDLLEQMASLGVNSVAIALLTTSTSGAVLALYFAPFLKQYGAEGFTGRGRRPRHRAGAGAGADRRGGRGAGRLGHRGGAGDDEGDGADRRPARAGGQPDPVSGRAARPGRRRHGAAGLRAGRRRRAFSAGTCSRSPRACCRRPI